jgi:hypothetical protein
MLMAASGFDDRSVREIASSLSRRIRLPGRFG